MIYDINRTLMVRLKHIRLTDKEYLASRCNLL